MIEGFGSRGRVDLSLGRSIFLHCAFCEESALRDFISCIFKEDLLRIFPNMLRFTGKMLQA